MKDLDEWYHMMMFIDRSGKDEVYVNGLLWTWWRSLLNKIWYFLFKRPWDKLPKDTNPSDISKHVNPGKPFFNFDKQFEKKSGSTKDISTKDFAVELVFRDTPKTLEEIKALPLSVGDKKYYPVWHSDDWNHSLTKKQMLDACEQKTEKKDVIKIESWFTSNKDVHKE